MHDLLSAIQVELEFELAFGQVQDYISKYLHQQKVGCEAEAADSDSEAECDTTVSNAPGNYSSKSKGTQI